MSTESYSLPGLITAIAGGVTALSAAAYQWYKVSRENRKRRSEVSEEERREVLAKKAAARWERQQTINQTLEILMREVKADRAYILLRHNGGKDLKGRSLQKISMVYEVVSDPLNIPKKAGFVKDIFVSEVIWWFTKTWKKEFAYLDAKQILHDDPTTYTYMQRWGIKSIVNAPIFDNSFELGVEPIAFIGFEWVTEQAPDFCDIYGSEQEAFAQIDKFGESIKQLLLSDFDYENSLV